MEQRRQLHLHHHLLPLILLTGCPTPQEDTGEAPLETGDTGAPEAPPTFRFSFVLVADPHVWAEGENADRLRRAVAWVNDNAALEDIRVVLFLGDMTWSEGLVAGPPILDALTVPWVPLLGDNEVQSADEEAFHTTYTPQYDALATTLTDWEKPQMPVWNPEHEQDSWFQNLTFAVEGVRFFGLDWTTRRIGMGVGEVAALHDFTGGTFPWFTDRLQALAPLSGQECVLTASHEAMFMCPGAFDIPSDDALEAMIAPLGDRVSTSWGGHFHADYTEEREVGGYTVELVQALWELDQPTLRLVRVLSNDIRCAYEDETVQVP